MIIICGNSIEEIEQNLHMAKMAVASGAPCGVGGATMADVEEALRMMGHMGLQTAISNPNYTPAPWTCPDCGAPLNRIGECTECEYPYEDEYPCGDDEDEEIDPLEELATRLRENGLYTPAVDALLDTLSDFLNH